MKILLVEDSENDAKLFEKYMLADLNAEVHIATTIKAALAIDADAKPDVVLLDLNLGASCPTEQTITHIPNFTAPVIVLTAMPDVTLESRAMLQGAVSFFQKMDAINNHEKFRDVILATVGRR